MDRGPKARLKMEILPQLVQAASLYLAFVKVEHREGHEAAESFHVAPDLGEVKPEHLKGHEAAESFHVSLCFVEQSKESSKERKY